MVSVLCLPLADGCLAWLHLKAVLRNGAMSTGVQAACVSASPWVDTLEWHLSATRELCADP